MPTSIFTLHRREGMKKINGCHVRGFDQNQIMSDIGVDRQETRRETIW